MLLQFLKLKLIFNIFEFTVFSQVKFAFIKIIHHFLASEDYIGIIVIMRLKIIEKKVKMFILVLNSRNEVEDLVNCAFVVLHNTTLFAGSYPEHPIIPVCSGLMEFKISFLVLYKKMEGYILLAM